MTLRSRFVRSLISIAIALCLILTMNPAFVSAIQVNSYDYQAQGLDRLDLISYDLAKSKGHIKRLTNLENENTFVFQNIDGTITSYTYEIPVQTRDERGQLHTIDLDFQQIRNMDGKTTGYIQSGSNHEVELPIELGESSQLIVSTDDFQLTMVPLNETGGKTTSAPGQLKKTSDYNGKIIYDNSFGQNTALELSSTLTGIKEDIVLKKFLPVMFSVTRSVLLA